jgi:hypothetical protein
LISSVDAYSVEMPLDKFHERASLILKGVKEEPQDSDDSEELQEPVDEGYNDNPTSDELRPNTVQLPSREPFQQRSDDFSSRRFEASHHQEQFSRSSVLSRDPRLKKNLFLEGGCSTEDLLRSADPAPPQNLSSFQNNAKRKAYDARNLLTTRQDSFYANIPKNPRIPDDHGSNRSPLTGSLFMSQATKGTAHEALSGLRYRNIPQNIQDAGNRVGADLDEISQAMEPPVATETPFDDLVSEDRIGDTKKTFADKEIQTTKNTGGFSITIDDLSTLTDQQRKALHDFKKVSESLSSLIVKCSNLRFLTP